MTAIGRDVVRQLDDARVAAALGAAASSSSSRCGVGAGEGDAAGDELLAAAAGADRVVVDGDVGVGVAGSRPSRPASRPLRARAGAVRASPATSPALPVAGGVVLAGPGSLAAAHAARARRGAKPAGRRAVRGQRWSVHERFLSVAAALGPGAGTVTSPTVRTTEVDCRTARGMNHG